MKKFWKALGIAALAAVVPVRVKKDEETGVKSFQSLLWKLDISPKDGENIEIGLDLMEGVVTAPLMNLIDARKEAELFTDDPEEAVLFADDEPEAAVVDAPAEPAGEEPDITAADLPVEPEATEEDFDPEV